MRPTGKDAAGNKWSRQANGYFRWKNANDEFLDANGKVVSDALQKSNPEEFNRLTHIMYEGPRQ